MERDSERERHIYNQRERERERARESAIERYRERIREREREIERERESERILSTQNNILILIASDVDTFTTILF